LAFHRMPPSDDAHFHMYKATALPSSSPATSIAGARPDAGRGAAFTVSL
jgi:hypothetical protein